MEPRSFSLQKPLKLLPVINEYLNTERRSSLWQNNNIQISNLTNSSKSPLNKNFFTSFEQNSQSPLSIRPSMIKLKPDMTRLREKQVKNLDLELDNQEIQHSESEGIKSIEPLFSAYLAYLDGLGSCISGVSILYKNALNRAKNGLNSIFRKLYAKVKHLDAVYDDKTSQTLMTINPAKYSVILSKLGDIINQEVVGSERLEKYIQKNFIANRRKTRVNNTGVQTEYKANNDGVISYEFKSYEQMQVELDSLRKINEALVQEKQIMERNPENNSESGKSGKKIRVFEGLVRKMKDRGILNDLDLNEEEEIVFNNS